MGTGIGFGMYGSIYFFLSGDVISSDANVKLASTTAWDEVDKEGEGPTARKQPTKEHPCPCVLRQTRVCEPANDLSEYEVTLFC